jgi:ribosomal protein S18 acetylase RimI-like enzyme
VKVVIRDAVAADLPALRDIFRRASLTNESDREALLAHPEVLELDDSLLDAGGTRVAEIDGLSAGFATVIVTGDDAELDDLFVAPEQMGNGIGRMLVLDSCSVAAASGARHVAVTANPAARQFYERVGFEYEGEADTRFGPAVRMRRLITT